jgi:hypothetical protein
VDLYFPNGVQILYRDYITDETIIIDKVDKQTALTAIGRLTGLEPRKHHSLTYPDEKTFPSRPVKGFYLLHTLPKLDRGQKLSPARFHPKTDEIFESMLQSVRQTWDTSTDIRKLYYFPYLYYFHR